MVTLVPIQNR